MHVFFPILVMGVMVGCVVGYIRKLIYFKHECQELSTLNYYWFNFCVGTLAQSCHCVTSESLSQFSNRTLGDTTVNVEHTGQAVSDSLCPLCWCPGDRTNSSEQIALLDEIQNPPGPGHNKIPVPWLPVCLPRVIKARLKLFTFSLHTHKHRHSNLSCIQKPAELCSMTTTEANIGGHLTIHPHNPSPTTV